MDTEVTNGADVQPNAEPKSGAEAIEQATQEKNGVEAQGDVSKEQSNDEEAKAQVQEKLEDDAKKGKAFELMVLEVNGEEITLNTPEEAKKYAQMGFDANKKWQEAATMKKDLEGFVGLLQSDPSQALELLGIDLDEFAEGHINKRIKDMEKSPEEKAQEAIQKELEDARKKLKEMEDQKKDAEFQELIKAEKEKFNNELQDALKEFKTLPNSKYVVKRTADIMRYAIQNGRPNITVKEILPIVEKEIRSDFNEILRSAPDDIIESFIGKDILSRMREKRIEEYKKTPQTTQNIKATGTQEQAKPKKKEKVSSRDFFKKIGKL